MEITRATPPTPVLTQPEGLRPNPSETVARASASASREHILVVEDEPAQQMISRIQLQKLGCDVTVASSGEEALALFAGFRNENKPSPFNLVMMDKVMQGIDGMTASREIRNLFPAQNIVIVSGYTPESHAREVAQLKLSWLVKPYTIADLASSIRAALRKGLAEASVPTAT